MIMKKTFQLMMAFAIAAFTLTSCEDVPEPYDVPTGDDSGEPVEGEYLNETFASSFGEFTLEEVYGTPWVIDYSTAKATGYDNSTGTTTPSESYLVSPSVDLSNSEGAYLQFQYILRYATNYGTPKDGVENKVLITTAYTGDATTTEWDDITGELTEGSDWDVWYDYTYNLDEKYIGQPDVRVALYYACEENSATWEVKNLTLLEGSADEGDSGDSGTDVVPAEGDGTEASPYNVTAAMNVGTAEGVYVKGYIVGYVSGLSYSSGTVFSSDTCTVTTNILIAAAAGETDGDVCMPVQLPSGDVRNGVNLCDNKGNLGQEVLLYGNIGTYFSVPGVRSVTYATVGGQEFGTKPSDDEEVVEGLLSETFASGIGSFSIVDIDLGGMNYVWSHTSSYSCMKASAYYNSSNTAAESWLVSPAFSLQGVQSPVLTFENAVNYLYSDALSDHLKLLVSTDYDGGGDVYAATWTELSFSPEPETDNSFTFVTSSASLSSYAGEAKVYIAFKYTSTTSCAPTYELKNLVVSDGGTSDDDDEDQGDSGEVSGNTITVDLSTFGYSNADDVDDIELTDGTVLTFAQEGGYNHPKYYDATNGVRMYALNSLTISAGSKTIVGVTLECDSYSGTTYVGNEQLYAEAGGTNITPTVSNTTVTFSGFSSNTLKIINDWTSNSGGTQLRIQIVEITYAE